MNLTRLLIAALMLNVALLAVVAWSHQQDSSVPAIREPDAVTQRDNPAAPPGDASPIESLPVADVSQGFAARPPIASDTRVTINQPIGPASTTHLPSSAPVERSDAILVVT